MPVKILTLQQRRQYGHFAPTISPEQIAKHCYLTPAEINKVIARRPQSWHQLGYAIQLMTVRFLGTFLELKEVLKVRPTLASVRKRNVRPLVKLEKRVFTRKTACHRN